MYFLFECARLVFNELGPDDLLIGRVIDLVLNFSKIRSKFFWGKYIFIDFMYFLQGKMLKRFLLVRVVFFVFCL